MNIKDEIKRWYEYFICTNHNLNISEARNFINSNPIPDDTFNFLKNKLENLDSVKDKKKWNIKDYVAVKCESKSEAQYLINLLQTYPNAKSELFFPIIEEFSQKKNCLNLYDLRFDEEFLNLHHHNQVITLKQFIDDNSEKDFNPVYGMKIKVWDQYEIKDEAIFISKTDDGRFICIDYSSEKNFPFDDNEAFITKIWRYGCDLDAKPRKISMQDAKLHLANIYKIPVDLIEISI